MNINQIIQLGQLIQNNCKCPSCQNIYKLDDMTIMATTKKEGMFELLCPKCNCQTILTTSLKEQRNDIKEINAISDSEIKTVKDFLKNFDGNFEKILKKQK